MGAADDYVNKIRDIYGRAKTSLTTDYDALGSLLTGLETGTRSRLTERAGQMAAPEGAVNSLMQVPLTSLGQQRGHAGARYNMGMQNLTEAEARGSAAGASNISSLEAGQRAQKELADINMRNTISAAQAKQAAAEASARASSRSGGRGGGGGKGGKGGASLSTAEIRWLADNVESGNMSLQDVAQMYGTDVALFVQGEGSFRGAGSEGSYEDALAQYVNEYREGAKVGNRGELLRSIRAGAEAGGIDWADLYPRIQAAGKVMFPGAIASKGSTSKSGSGGNPFKPIFRQTNLALAGSMGIPVKGGRKKAPAAYRGAFQVGKRISKLGPKRFQKRFR